MHAQKAKANEEESFKYVFQKKKVGGFHFGLQPWSVSVQAPISCETCVFENFGD